MKFQLILSAVFLLFSSINLSAQNDSYLYSRNEGESAKAFVERHMTGDFEETMQATHDVIEGNWGDESKGKKIMAFYNGVFTGENYDAVMVIFQPVGDGKNYIISFYEGLGGLGRYYNGVISVFFMDVDNDGAKELFLIEKGEVRVPITFDVQNEDGEWVTEETTACCDDVFYTRVIRQMKMEKVGFLPNYLNDRISSDLELYNLENAVEVKAAVQAYLDKQND